MMVIILWILVYKDNVYFRYYYILLSRCFRFLDNVMYRRIL